MLPINNIALIAQQAKHTKFTIYGIIGNIKLQIL